MDEDSPDITVQCIACVRVDDARNLSWMTRYNCAMHSMC